MSQTHKSMHRVHMDGVMEIWKDRNWEGDGKVRDKRNFSFLTWYAVGDRKLLLFVEGKSERMRDFSLYKFTFMPLLHNV